MIDFHIYVFIYLNFCFPKYAPVSILFHMSFSSMPSLSHVIIIIMLFYTQVSFNSLFLFLSLYLSISLILFLSFHSVRSLFLLSLSPPARAHTCGQVDAIFKNWLLLSWILYAYCLIYIRVLSNITNQNKTVLDKSAV